MTSMDGFALWRRTLGDKSDDMKPQREFLRQAFLGFRDRTAQLVSEIGPQLPGLTVHDITHIDALWRVANEVAGPDYPLNPAEAFILGGAFLLHDAAHVLAAYEDGLVGVKRSIEWKDLIAQQFNSEEPPIGSPQECSALFQVLRHLHAKRARDLTKVYWTVPSNGAKVYLLEKLELREYYGDLIGEIAESHHWDAHRVAETFKSRRVSPPSFLAPAEWSVDALKVAFILRTADAAHIDGDRAPWFLFALRQPDGISQLHWQFQAKIGQPVRSERGELRLSSSPFDEKDRHAWWLAYDAACLMDKELRHAQMLLRDANRPPFATVSVEYVTTPQAFATNVRTNGWEPVDVGPKIGDVPKVIASLGGARLYGRRPELALRELLQNAADAVRARRTLGEIGQKDGEIEVALMPDGDVTWLHVTDTGIGMSRFVLTEVLLDFGNSLWSSETMRSELPGLAAQRFCPVGRFGIGFFSVFMLGQHVIVTTRRFNRISDDNSEQWLLEFGNGLDGRPTLRRPITTERLPHPGTKISVAIETTTLRRLLTATSERFSGIYDLFEEKDIDAIPWLANSDKKVNLNDLKAVVASLCPTLDIKVLLKIAQRKPVTVVRPNDWMKLKPEHLCERLPKIIWSRPNPKKLLDLRDDTGALLGRVGYSGSLDKAVVTFGGINSGKVPGLIGILLGENNSDLARLKSRPKASSENWQKWASDWIDKYGGNDIEALATLHPLCPEKDLTLYCVGEKQFSEVQLTEWFKGQDEICVLDGFPEHEDFDEISADTFKAKFHLNPDILVLPSPKHELTKCLEFSPIDYAKRIKAALREAWGEFEDWEEDDFSIGEVDGTEIIRPITRYVKITE